MVLLSSTISLLIFCLLDLSISDRGMLKSATIIVDLSVSLCNSISFCHMYFDALLLGLYILRIVFEELTSLSLCNKWSSLGFRGGSVVKNLPASVGDADSIPGREDPLEEEMATHSSILA